MTHYKNQFLPSVAIWDQKIRVYQEDNQSRGYTVQEDSAQELHTHECIYTDEEVLQHMIRYLAQGEKTVHVDLDTEAQVEGRRRSGTYMMIRQFGKQTFPQDCLFIREGLQMSCLCPYYEYRMTHLLDSTLCLSEASSTGGRTICAHNYIGF